MVRRKEAVGVQQDGDSLNEVLLEQFREQMNNLAAAVQLLDPVVREQGEQYEPYLSILYQSMYRMLRLMGNMEYLQLDRRGNLELREASMDLAGLCRELAGQVAPLTELAGVQFTYEEEKGMLLTRGDGRLLRRMLLALIANAVQAAGRGGRAGLRLAVRGARVSLTVWDSGPGLAGQKREGGLLDRPAGPSSFSSGRTGALRRWSPCPSVRRKRTGCSARPLWAWTRPGAFPTCWWSWPACCPTRRIRPAPWSEMPLERKA